MIRVLHIIPDGSVGGGNVNVGRLARSLEGRVDCRFLAPADSDDAVLSMFPEEKTRRGAYASKQGAVALARAIVDAADDADILHAQGTRAAAGLMLARPFLRGRRTVYTVRGYHGLRNPDRLGLKIRLERLLGQTMDRVVHVSMADRDIGLAHRAFGANARTIPNGIEPLPDPTEDRSVDLLFLGRHVYQKDPIAFADMVGHLPSHLTVEVAGDGDLGPQVRARLEAAGRTVTLRGALDHAQALQAMARARILVMTSRWEGLPTTAIEAAMQGAAVYGFGIPPLAEVLGETASDALVETRDPAALALLTAAALESGAWRDVARRQQTRVRDEYTTERMGRLYQELYAELLEAAPA